MNISRRDVLRGIAATALGGGVLQAMEGLALALSEKDRASPVVWLNPEGADHNFEALLGRVTPGFFDLIANQWDLRGLDALRPTGHRLSAKGAPAAAPVLILENLPGVDGDGAELADQIAAWLPLAKTAILLGTAACFGGQGVAAESVHRFERLCRRERTPIIKLPGVPAPPQHLVGVVSHLEFFGFPRLDALRRPLLYYGESVCRACERRDDLETGRFAASLGERGCLLKLGCKGPLTHNSCSSARWNGGENWCVGAGGPCTGCSEPGFPDHGGLGLYGPLSGGNIADRSLWLQALEGLGLGILGVAGAGIGLRVARNVLFPAEKEHPEALPGEGGE